MWSLVVLWAEGRVGRDDVAVAAIETVVVVVVAVVVC
mgnify:CR=1 FL=1